MTMSTQEAVAIAEEWAWEASENAAEGPDGCPFDDDPEWQRARRLWAMVDRMRGVA